MGIDQKNLAVRQHQPVHASVGANARAFANDLIQIIEMVRGGTPGAADQAIHIAFVQQHASDQGQAAAHLDLGHLCGHTPALHQPVIGLPEIPVAMVLLNIHDVVVKLFFQTQAEFLDALGDHRRPTDQGRTGQAFVHHNLAGAQHAFFFTLGVGHTFFSGLLGSGKNRLHGGAGGVHKTLQLLAVGVHVGDGPQSHPAVSCRLGHSRRNLHHQARVKGFGNQIFRAKRQFFTGVGGSNHLTLLSLGQLGNGVHSGNFHFDGDGGRTGIESATKNIRETQDVVDLIRVIGTACGHDRVIAYRLDVFRRDFRVWVGQRKNDGIDRHLSDHVFFEYTTCRQA